MTAEPLKEFIKRTETSKSSILRFYNKNPKLKSEVKLIKGKNHYPIEHARYFNLDLMIEKYKLLTKQYESTKLQLDKLILDIIK